ncbi:GlcG/HbpS family heme-binding protein [Pseudohalioglobus lutimaris]|uniref:GlcG/HbpS family heme-binding protein n=1 Tax=Pseudohalioglobus lutimaris TaxID=1737061 RepID=UPI0018DE14C7|nr:heme-binding protein [Pseudohalioglobus lutimaris]
MTIITSANANEIILRATLRASELGVAACISIVDAGAHLLAFQRMDGASLGPVDVSQRKARTAVLFQMPTGDFGKVIVDHGLTGMELSNGGLAAFHGGLPILDGDIMLGAIGVSGGSAEQDLDIARYALAGR